MDFQALQAKFAKKHLDTRTEWILAGTDNKEALNDGYKEVFNKARIDTTMQTMLKTTKTLVTMVGITGALPSDFLQRVEVYFKSGSVYNEVDTDKFPYRIQKTLAGHNIVFEQVPSFDVYIEYIQTLDPLVDNADETILGPEYDEDIINYALVEYFRNQRDWQNVSNSLQYAEGKLQERIEQTWQE